VLHKRVLIQQALFIALAAAGCSDISSPPPTSHSALAQFAATASADSQGTYVSTPMGWRLASEGHVIPKGHILSLWAGHMQERDAAGNLVQDLGPYSQMPGDGPFIPANPLLGGSGIPQLLGTGWIAYTLWDRPAGHAITADTARWVVPPKPTSINGQQIYLFNGIQDSASWLLQPVLQFGRSRAGGTDSTWSAACWNVSLHTYATTGAVTVIPGDTVIGITDSSDGRYGGGYAYFCSVNSSSWQYGPSELWLFNGNYQPWPEYWQAVEVLEAEGTMTSCSDYPPTDSTAFWSIGIHAHGLVLNWLSWSPYNAVTDCGQHVNPVFTQNPGGEVDVFYLTPPPPPPPPPGPPTVTISGPSTVRRNATCTWSAGVTGGVPPYAYSWTPGGAQTSDVTMSWSSSGTLSVWVTDSLNHGSGAQMSITVSPSAPICIQQ